MAIRNSMGKGAAWLFGGGLLVVGLIGGVLTDSLIFPGYSSKANDLPMSLLKSGTEPLTIGGAMAAIP